MAWFIISLVGVFENLDAYQQQYPIDEDIILYEAETIEKLNIKIQETIEVYDSAGAEGINYCNKPAKNYCLGVRQINYFPDKPSDGTWVYHSAMKVKNWQDVELLANGKAVEVQFLDINNQGDNL